MDAVMLSHGHWDHAGGLTRALDLIVNAKGFHENNDGLHADIGTGAERGVELASLLIKMRSHSQKARLIDPTHESFVTS